MSKLSMSQRIECLLRADEVDFGEFNLLEKEGDAAFDLLLAKLDEPGLSADERARGINMLLMLTRQFCVRRLPDAVRAALRFTSDSDPVVRASAVSAAMRGSRVIPAFRELARMAVDLPTPEQVHDAVAKAAALGIDDDLRAEVEGFMKPREWGPDGPDE